MRPVDILRLSHFIGIMQGVNKERWLELCAQAAVEQDPARMLELVKEINDLLEEKERRLGIFPPEQPNPSASKS